MNFLRLTKAVLIALLPSWIKIPLLRLMGAKIGKRCHIGLSIIDCTDLILGDSVRIASFNLIHRVRRLSIGDGARLNGFNWITGANTGDFLMARNVAITRLHFFEASGTIHIEENTIIAGRGSHFFTHGISPTNLDDVRSISIGPWCYIGSSSRFVPGSSLARGTFVGMGAVVTKSFSEEYVLIAGSPASFRKKLSEGDKYFSRKFLPHDHHPDDYDGGGAA